MNKARCKGSKIRPEIWSGNKSINDNQMWEIKNIYTEKMFFKEHWMSSVGLAASWRKNC